MLPETLLPNFSNRPFLILSMFPVLFVKNSRSKPFKEQAFSRSSVDFIGNNYSPQAKDLNLYTAYHLPYEMEIFEIHDILQDIPSFKKRSFQASRPQSPLSRKIFQSWPDAIVNDRYQYYITEIIKEEDICDLASILTGSYSEGNHASFKSAMKRSVLNYILIDRKEIQRLQIMPNHPVFPFTLRSPVPWCVRATVVKLGSIMPLYFNQTIHSFQNSLNISSTAPLLEFNASLPLLFAKLKIFILEWKRATVSSMQILILDPKYDQIIDQILKNSLYVMLDNLSRYISEATNHCKFITSCIERNTVFQSSYAQQGLLDLKDFETEIQNLMEDVKYKKVIDMDISNILFAIRTSFFSLFEKLQIASTQCHELLFPYSMCVSGILSKISLRNNDFVELGLEILQEKKMIRQIPTFKIQHENVIIDYKNILDEWLIDLSKY